MQRMDNHSWYKVMTTNIKNDFNSTFHKRRCLGHLECQNHLYNYLVFNGTPNEIAWIRNTIHNLSNDYFAPSLPFCKICNVVSLYVNTVLFACITLCISKLIWLEWRFTLKPMIIMLPRASVEMSWNKSNFWSKKRFLIAYQLPGSIFPWLQVKLFFTQQRWWWVNWAFQRRHTTSSDGQMWAMDYSSTIS